MLVVWYIREWTELDLDLDHIELDPNDIKRCLDDIAISADPSGEISAKQSPPMPVIWGSAMVWTATAVIAASTALPPSVNTFSPAAVAMGWDVVIMAFRARTAERPG